MSPKRIPQFSAGGVLVRLHEGSVQLCLIRRKRYQQETWCLPKGHLEPGETADAAALREVIEETGATGAILKLIGEVHYQFSIPGKNKHFDKTVTFYLMRALVDELHPQDTVEVMEARWFHFEEALENISYDNERTILRQAQDSLQDADIQQQLAQQT